MIKLDHDGPVPPQGTGHYSADGRQWFDDEGRRWVPVAEGCDSLVIELEDLHGVGLVRALLTGPFAHTGTAHSRFVARATSDDPRWPQYRIESAVFHGIRGLPDALPPEEEWAPDMVAALAELRHRLETEGWLQVEHGGHPWTYRYTRPCLDWASDAPGEPLAAGEHEPATRNPSTDRSHSSPGAMSTSAR